MGNGLLNIQNGLMLKKKDIAMAAGALEFLDWNRHDLNLCSSILDRFNINTILQVSKMHITALAEAFT